MFHPIRIATIAASAFVALVLAGLPSPAQADAIERMAKQKAEQEALEAKKKKWVTEYQSLTASHAALQAKHARLMDEYSRRRNSIYLRGDRKGSIMVEIKEVEAELAKSQQEVDAFPDKARRAGALPGWFRDAPPASAKNGAQAAGAEKDADAAPADPRAGRAFQGGSKSRAESLSERNARAREKRREAASQPAARSDDRDDDDEDFRGRSVSDQRRKDRDRRRLR